MGAQKYAYKLLIKEVGGLGERKHGVDLIGALDAYVYDRS